MDGCTDGVTAHWSAVAKRNFFQKAKPTWLSPRDHPSIREALFRPFGYSS